jgi:hypothetical protein
VGSPIHIAASAPTLESTVLATRYGLVVAGDGVATTTGDVGKRKGQETQETF